MACCCRASFVSVVSFAYLFAVCCASLTSPRARWTGDVCPAQWLPAQPQAAGRRWKCDDVTDPLQLHAAAAVRHNDSVPTSTPQCGAPLLHARTGMWLAVDADTVPRVVGAGNTVHVLVRRCTPCELPGAASALCDDVDFTAVARSDTEIVNVAVRPLGDGRFTLSFTPHHPGALSVSVKLKWWASTDAELSTPLGALTRGEVDTPCDVATHVAGSPFQLRVEAWSAADALGPATPHPRMQLPLCTDASGLSDGRWVQQAVSEHPRVLSAALLNDAFGYNAGWVWQPRSCRVNLFDGHDFAQCLQRRDIRKIVLFGDSMVREHLVNMLSLLLPPDQVNSTVRQPIWHGMQLAVPVAHPQPIVEASAHGGTQPPPHVLTMGWHLDVRPGVCGVVLRWSF